MKKIWIVVAAVALVVLIFALMGCNAPPPAQSGFNLIFRYGVGARNELNTFKGTYTRDMVQDPSITIPLSLTKDDLDKIYQKMVEIDFFSYPDEFSVSVPPGDSIGMVTPYSSYYFKVEYDSQVKELRWDAQIINPNDKADKLRELIKLITDIIQSKEEYKQLPQPTSGYM